MISFIIVDAFGYTPLAPHELNRSWNDGSDGMRKWLALYNPAYFLSKWFGDDGIIQSEAVSQEAAALELALLERRLLLPT